MVVGLLFQGVFFCVGMYALYTAAMMYGAGNGLADYGPWAGIGTTFVLVSGIGVVRLWRRRTKAAAVQALKKKHADALWKVRPEWRSTTITEKAESDGWFLVIFALVWNGVTWPLAVYILYTEFVAKTTDPQWGALMVLLFPLVGLGVGWLAVKPFLHRHRYGTSTLEMETIPARLGQRLQARVRTHMDVGDAPENGFHVRLACYHRYVRYTTDSDGDRKKKVVKDEKWRNDQHVHGRSYGALNQLEVPVTFDLPDRAPASTPEKSEERMMWEVHVDADVPGLDYDVSFEIPVFPSEASRRDASASSDAVGPEASAGLTDGAASATDAFTDASTDASTDATVDATADTYGRYDVESSYDAPVSDGIHVERPSGGGIRVRFDARRALTLALVTLLAGCVFFGVGVALFVTASLLGGLIFGGVGGGLLYFAAWPMLTHSSTLTVQAGTVSFRKGAFGGGKTISFPARELLDVRVEKSGRSGDKTVYALVLYQEDPESDANVRETSERFVGFLRKSGLAGAKSSDDDLDAMIDAIDREGKRLQVAGHLTNKGEADWIASEVVKAVERESAFA